MAGGVQVVSIFVFVAIAFAFFKHKRISLLSTKIFITLLFIVFVTISLELFCSLNVKYFPEQDLLFKIVLKTFIAFLNITIYALFIYLDIKLCHEKRLNKLTIALKTIPLVIAIIATSSIPLSIENFDIKLINPIMIPSYFLALIYFLTGLIGIKRKKYILSKEYTLALSVGISLFLAISIVDIFCKEIHLLSCGCVIVLLIFFIFLENPRDYRVHEIKGILNRYAFFKRITELYESGEKFFIVDIAIIKNTTYNEMIKELSKTLGTIKDFNVYNVLDNTYCFIAKSEEEIQAIANYKSLSHLFIYNYFVIEVPKCAKDKLELLSLIEYLDRYKKVIPSSRIDEKFVEYKKYLDKVLDITKEAIYNDGLDVEYQPIYSNKLSRYVSMEALTRIKDRTTLGYIPPDVFIKCAEDNGLIIDLSKVVFEKICAFVKSHDFEAMGIQSVGVNISSLQAIDSNFAKDYIAIMDKYQVDPKFFSFEITETVSTMTSTTIGENMEMLKAKGSKFFMDDFGTGFSNIRKIMDLKFEVIKIDKSLIWPAFGFNSTRDTKYLHVLKSVVDMIKNAVDTIVVEGVETKEMDDFFKENGVDLIQGYYYAKVMNENTFLEFIKEKNKVKIS